MQPACLRQRWVAAVLAGLTLAACANDHSKSDEHEHELEVISRVELTFTPQGGGSPLVVVFNDPDGDGGISGTAEPIQLRAGVTYGFGVRFENGLVTPFEDITQEIQAEAEGHLVFITGDVNGPASASAMPLLTVAYADRESDYTINSVGEDLPVGLLHTVTALQAGHGEFRIILRHVPSLNGVPQKSADLPDRLAKNEALPGNVDVDLTFDLTVSP